MQVGWGLRSQNNMCLLTARILLPAMCTACRQATAHGLDSCTTKRGYLLGAQMTCYLAGTVPQQNPSQPQGTMMIPWVPSSVLRSRYAVAHFQGWLHSRHRPAAQPTSKLKDSGGATEAQHTYSAGDGLQICLRAT